MVVSMASVGPSEPFLPCMMDIMNSTMKQLSYFKFPGLVLGVGILLALVTRGAGQALIVAVLAVLEISLSFDNAVLNASILRRMNAFWQKMFLTVGMLIAVVGMRLFFPIAIVVATAGVSFGKVVDLALHHPAEYAEHLQAAHPAIAAFGGMFLLMIFLDFVIDESKRLHWVDVIERPLAKAGRLKTLSTLLALLALVLVTLTWGRDEAHDVLFAGVIGQITYLFVRGLSQFFEHITGMRPEEGTVERPKLATSVAQVGGRAALFLFIYLEVLDASFSFDGVIGAFAITSDVLTIALGLGIGALFVRALTVWLVRHNTLSEFIYLEHGAHYAVGALAVLMAVSLAHDVPEAVTGLIGAGFIVMAIVASLSERRSQAGLLK
jgi:hypothetical protein